jgi:hypothetical protein
LGKWSFNCFIRNESCCVTTGREKSVKYTVGYFKTWATGKY